MSTSAAPDWAGIRRRYEETDAAVADICTEAGIERAALTAAVRKGGWRRQKPRPFPPLRIPIGSAASSPAGPVLPRPAGPPRAGDRARTTAPAKAKPTRVSSTSTAHTAPSTKPPTAKKSAAKRTASKPSRPAATGAPTPRPAPPKLLTPADRRHLLDRLVAAISRKLEQLEHRMALDLDDAATATDHDRESRAIGALIDNLGKITEMETGLARTSGKSDPTDIAGDADRWRRELAGRLAKIVGAAPGAA